MKVILLGAVLCLIAGTQAGVFEDALALLTKEERAFAEKLRDFFNKLGKGKDQTNEVEGITRGLISDINQHCDCEKNSCGCCGKVDAMGSKMDACANVSIISNEYALQIKGKLGFLNLIDEKVSLKKLEKACKNMPLFSKIKLCIQSKMDQLENQGDFKYCMAVELEAYGTTVSYINFRCLKFVDGVLSSTDEMMDVDPDKDPAIAVDSPNPIKALVELIKNAKKNADKNKE